MRYSRLAIAVFAVAAVLLSCAVLPRARAEDVPRMSTDELKTRLGDADLTILDVRTEGDWNQSSQKIVGAIRVDPRGVREWAGNYPKEKLLVLYCA